MAWFLIGGKQCWHKALLAAATCGVTAQVAFADELQEPAVEIPALQPDEELGPIRLPESPAESSDAPEWKPNWRQPTPARVAPPPARTTAPSNRAVAENPLAPPEINLPEGTDAPPIEPEPTKHPTQRRNRSSMRTADASSSMPAQSNAGQSSRRGASTRTAKATPTPQLKSPVDVEIPGMTDIGESATLPESNLPADSKENTPARRGFMSRIFRSSPPSPAETQRPARTGWGGLFRSGPVSR